MGAGIEPLPPSLLGTIVLIAIAYVVATGWQKPWFYPQPCDQAAQEERAG